MTKDKIEEIINSRVVQSGIYVIISHKDAAKEIYKLHLESQLELLHNVNDKSYSVENEELLEDIIHDICEELESKLKKLK